MAFVEIDKSLFPVIVISVKGELNLEQSERHLDTLEELLEKSDQPLVFVMDLRLATGPSAAIRASIAHWVEYKYGLLKNQLVEIIFVHPSPLMAVLLKTVFTTRRLPIPARLSARLAEGIQWAEQRALRIIY